LTGAEQQAIVEDFIALGDALEAAGLRPDVDLETMSETEYEMRENLAIGFYEQES
jgi:hypothetical protein